MKKVFAPILGLFLLAACATHINGPTLASDTQFAADAFTAFVGDVSAFGVVIPPATIAQVDKLAQDVEANASGIATALDQGDVLNKIAGDVTLAGNLLQPYFAKAPSLATALNATVKLFEDVAAHYGFTLTKASA